MLADQATGAVFVLLARQAERLKGSLSLVPWIYDTTFRVCEGAQKFANGIAIEIRGDLWAYPVPEQLYIRTEIDLDTGKYTV